MGFKRRVAGAVAAVGLAGSVLLAPAALQDSGATAEAANGQYIVGLRGNDPGCGNIGIKYRSGITSTLTGSSPRRAETQGNSGSVRYVNTTSEWGVREIVYKGGKEAYQISHNLGTFNSPGWKELQGAQIRSTSDVASALCVVRRPS